MYTGGFHICIEVVGPERESLGCWPRGIWTLAIATAMDSLKLIVI